MAGPRTTHRIAVKIQPTIPPQRSIKRLKKIWRELASRMAVDSTE